MRIVSEKPRASFRRLRRNQSGAVLMEFALIAPVMMVLMMGAMDVSHTLYMNAILQGALQKAARDSSLETTDVNVIDQRVRNQVLLLVKDSATDIDIDRQFYHSFSDAAAAQAETFTDTNGDGACNNGEPYIDQNNNSFRDLDGGGDGRGNAKDTVVYKVTVSYPRMFPLNTLVSLISPTVLSPTTTLEAKTVLANQPYGDQADPTVRYCT